MNILKYLSAMLVIVAIAACGNPNDNTCTVERTKKHHHVGGPKRVQRGPGRCVDYKRVKPGKHFKHHGKKPCGRKNAFAFCNVKRAKKEFDVVFSAPFALDAAQASCSELKGTFNPIQ